MKKKKCLINNHFSRYRYLLSLFTGYLWCNVQTCAKSDKNGAGATTFTQKIN